MDEWTPHYKSLTEPFRYGSVATYALAADWMRPCRTVEDWGCGGGGLRGYIELGNPEAVYLGVDGSTSPFADVHADLTTYRPQVAPPQGVVLRHVLEHSYEWQAILTNAIDCVRRRLCIVLFTPWVSSTHVLHTEPDYGDVPVIAFAERDILGPLHDARFDVWVDSYRLDGAHFGTETVIRAQRP